MTPILPKRTREIVLTRGKVAIIDDDDFGTVSQHKWCAQKAPNSPWYAITTYREAGKQKSLYMQRLLLNPKKDELIDFVDGDGLNLRRSNMRISNASHVQANRGLLKSNKSGFKGVSASKKDGRWNAYVCVKGRSIKLGSFLTPDEAARKYDAAAKLHFGEFARLNFSDVGKAI